MRFLTYIKSDESMPAGPPPPELFEAIGKFGEEIGKTGVLLDQGGLAATSDSVQIRVADGKVTVTDGPFAETKEVIGGYAMYDVRSKDEAVELSRRFMQIHADIWPGFVGTSEIRQVFGPSDFEG